MKRTVCVDLDGVLADYSQGFQGIEMIGEPIPGAVQFTKELAEFASILVYTTRCSERVEGGSLGTVPDGGEQRSAKELQDIVKAWLDKHGFVYDDVWIGQGKPIASAYIDDRAVECVPRDYPQLTFSLALCRCQQLVFPQPYQFKGAAEIAEE